MLKPLKFTPFTVNEIKAKGWVKRQLEIQAKGLSGNLDKVWPDVRDSKWIGGDQEGWERVPYWLDGFIPLAYLLDDADMKARAKKYIDAILDRQKEDGWICPCEDEERPTYDVWAAFLICKVLVVYYECTGDERIEEAVYKTYKNLDVHINAFTLANWATTRWYEAFISIFWLYERKKEDWLIDLCYKLYIQGIDYKKMFDNFRMKKPDPKGVWTYLTHVVNLSMALKSEALMGRIDGRDGNDFANNAINLLQKYHGMPTGQFTGDECLSGTSPIQGTELCGVVEAMYSYEHLISLTGDSRWGDLLERLTFNALPATISPDMWTHQYDQLTNQVQCNRLPDGIVHFQTNGPESHVFGLEPTYGCCTSNFNQAYPKFALSTWMGSEDGFACISIVPSLLETKFKDANVKCETVSQYPFKDSAKIIVSTDKAVEFTVHIRVPEFADYAKINGKIYKNSNFANITQVWSGNSEIEIEYIYNAKIELRPSGMICVNRGPLLFSLNIDADWEMREYTARGVERKFPYCDYNLLPKSKWNYAFVSEKFAPKWNNLSDVPFSPETPAITLTAQMAEIEWEMENNMCTMLPKSTKLISHPVEIELIPYGCTNLRMTEMPFVNITE